MRIALPVLALLALTSCRTLMDPTFMPAGYTYHDNYYKAPPGAEAAPIGYPYTPERNDVVMEKWQAVAEELTGVMESRLALYAQPVYLAPLTHHNAFNASLDYALREELRKKGYTLQGQPSPGVLHLQPEAFMPEDEKVLDYKKMYNDDLYEPTVVPPPPEKARDFLMILTATRGNVIIGEVRGTFFLPAYGYKKGEGQDEYKNKDYLHRPPARGPSSAAQELQAPEKTVPEHSSAPESLLPSAVPADVTQEPL